mgnify:CR=1 FL=1
MKLSEQFQEEIKILKGLKGKALIQHLFQYYKWRILAILLCFVILLSAVVNAIVKKDYVYVDIPSDGMDEVVSTDSESITITTGLPYGKVRICDLDTCRNSSGTSVDTVEAISIHIIRKT